LLFLVRILRWLTLPPSSLFLLSQSILLIFLYISLWKSLIFTITAFGVTFKFHNWCSLRPHPECLIPGSCLPTLQAHFVASQPLWAFTQLHAFTLAAGSFCLEGSFVPSQTPAQTVEPRSNTNPSRKAFLTHLFPCP
jgi:hypothetical protein